MLLLDNTNSQFNNTSASQLVRCPNALHESVLNTVKKSVTEEFFEKTPSVLLFEPNLKTSVGLNQVLTENGIAVTTACSADELETIVESGRFDSIIISASPDNSASFKRAMNLVKGTPIVTIGPGTGEFEFIRYLKSKFHSQSL